MKITVLSPHVDDAVFSLAESMLTWIEDGHELTVLSVFAGVPFHDEEGRRKHAILRSEHARAMKRLGVEHTELDFLDDVYKPRPKTEEVAEAMRGAVSTPDRWVAPTGIHHPDHRETWCAFLIGPGDLACPRERIWQYDEIPYYVQRPQQAKVKAADCRVGTRPHYQEKMRLVHEYRSQLNEDLLRCLFVPERVWC